MDAQRKLLDALMGAGRNGDANAPPRQQFTDADICRYFLCGLCPHDLFQNTRMAMGDCAKVHSDVLKMEYEETRKTKDYGYELELEAALNKLIDECDRRISKSQKRIEENERQEAEATAVIAEQINELVRRAEKLGEEGKVEESMQLQQQAEELKQRKATISASIMQQMDDGVALPPVELPANFAQQQQQQQKLRCCEECGLLLSLYDSDRRLADHFGGKMHMGYVAIREKLRELQDWKKQHRQFVGDSSALRRDDRDSHRDRDRDRGDRRDRDRDRDYRRDDRDSHRGGRGDRGGDHDRGGDRRGGDRDRDRDYRSSRDSNRDRDRRDRSPRRGYDRR